MSLNIQAFIANISFPKNLEGLRNYVDDQEVDLESMVSTERFGWSCPKWALRGDIVFFYHAITVDYTLKKLRRELESDYREDPYYQGFKFILDIADYFYELYGGKIFSIAKVVDKPEYFDSDLEYMQWKHRIYSDMEPVALLKNPIDISEFRDFIYLNRGGTFTPVLGDDYNKLIDIISSKNYIPRALEMSESIPVPLKDINKNNWISVTGKYRRKFFLEEQFRKYYLDYFLRELGDIKKFNVECDVYRNNIRTGRIDYIIKLDKKLLMVEAKLNSKSERDLRSQVERYSNIDLIKKNNVVIEKNKEIIKRYVLLVDIYEVVLYDSREKEFIFIENLDNIENIMDIKHIREKIIKYLS